MRVYTVPTENNTLANSGGDTDVWACVPASNKPIAFLGFELDNVGGTADAGDAQEEFLRLAVIIGHTTVGSGGAAVTPVPLNPADAAAGFTARVNDTTIASAGSATTVMAFGVNIRIPGPVFWGDKEHLDNCPQLSAATSNNRMVLRCLSTPADDIAVSGTLWVAEF